ncbi:MAG: arylsulfatase [Verrucomicrobiota bacterium]
MKTLTIFACALLGWLTTAAASEKPNIVYILADDMGYGDVQALNPDGKIKTPHLDAMVEGGMHFTDAHTSSSVCTPTRYGILTGRYNWRTRLKSGVLWGYSSHLIAQDRLTVPKLLKENGYTTHCIGKWHLGMDWAMKPDASDERDRNGDPLEYQIDFTKPITNGPLMVGFDTYFGHSASLDMPPYVYIRDNELTAIPTEVAPKSEFGREGLKEAGLMPEEVLPDLTDEAVDVISKWKEGESHFLYMPLPAPHTPIVPNVEWQGKSGINAYADFCMEVDHIVGRVTQAIADAGLKENTLVIFTADNGCSPRGEIPEMAAKGHHTHLDFRGHKADIYEGGHRVAFIAQWPAKIEPGSRSDQIICTTDLLATCAEIVGASYPDNAGEDSVSILPALIGEDEAPLREAVVHHSINGSFAIRRGDWKLIFCPGSGGWSDPRPGRVDMSGMPENQLYHLGKDRSETNNLVAEHPEIVEELTALMADYVDRGRSTPGENQTNEGDTPFHYRPPVPRK